jgi:ABC-2 type transport system permease protein
VTGYLALARASWRALTTYRLGFVLGLFGQVFQMVALLAVWRVLLREGHGFGGYGWAQIKAYLLVAFGTGALMSTFGDWGMANRIRSGMVALDLTRPVDYQGAQLASAAGRIGAELVATGVVALGVVALTGSVATPEPGQAVLFAASVLLVIPIKFSIVYLSTMLCFWTENYNGVIWLRTGVANLMSGALVPLSFFPGWLHSTALALPFASTTSSPALIYLGQAHGAGAARLLAIQLVWAVALIFGSRLVWRWAIRQLTVHGG